MHFSSPVKILGNREEKRVTSFKGCLTDPAVLEKAMEGVSSVFHIAGHISYGTFPDFKQMNKINIDGKVLKYLTNFRMALTYTLKSVLLCL